MDERECPKTGHLCNEDGEYKMQLIALGIALYVALVVLVVWPLLKVAGPQNAAEQLRNDNEQLEYLRNNR